jgi:hypothetical protein
MVYRSNAANYRSSNAAETSVGLYPKGCAGLNDLHLAIEFPDFNRLALADMSNITVVNWLDQIKDSAVGSGTIQFYVFRMTPDQGTAASVGPPK